MRHRSQNGFTLVELLVAFAILALSLTAIFRIFSDGLRGTDLAEDYGKAVGLAQSTLARVGVDPDLPFDPGIHEGQFDGDFAWRLEIATVNEPAEAPDSQSQLDAFHAVLTVLWSENGKQRSINLETVRVQPAIE